MDAGTSGGIGEWIMAEALAGTGEVAVVAGVCERLRECGVALVRASVAHDLLDPTFDARGVRWLRGEGAVEQSFPRSDDPLAHQDWITSPFYVLLESKAPMMRRRLGPGHPRGEFDMLDRFADQGVTDYVAFASRVGDSVRLGEGQGIMASWTTDAPGGFTDDQVALLAGILRPLTLAFVLQIVASATRTLLHTYLGADAADRVLAGNIVRGRAEPIRAVVWYSDLVGFTRITDTASAGTVLELLNDYAEAQVEAIEGQGGHVLKFIGDGMLAIFPQPDMAQACRCALAAARALRERIAALNVQRAERGKPVTEAHLALHVGELLYGNVGGLRRLDFTVLGPAVNEAARIEAFCASLEQPVIVSSAFADAAGEARSTLVSVGRYAMKGIARPQELFTLDPSDAGTSRGEADRANSKAAS
jgi:adenylate cyclase